MAVLVNPSKINNSLSYENYKTLVFSYSENNKTSGDEQIPERVAATKLNAQRIKRLDKQIELNSEIKNELSRINKKWTWVVLIETWCGDGAQNIPVIAKIAQHNPNIELKIILRDENPEIMSAYLTNGSRSIPKLICFDSDTKEEIGSWGPRPEKIQQMVKEFKLTNPHCTHEELVKNIHLWYARDKGESTQKEFAALLSLWNNN